MPPVHLQHGGNSGADQRHAGEIIFLRWPWERLGTPPEELEEVAGMREVRASLLKQLPHDQTLYKWQQMDGWMGSNNCDF